jgi:PadR family transcriptional regulator, regulatory protein AphA
MARENKTRYALLGLLTMGPMSGYDIKKLTDFSLGYFWSENYGHIYPILKKLEEEGLVTGRTEHTRGKPDRNVFSLTETGRREFDEWLSLPSEKQPIRNEFLLKLFFGRRLPGADVEAKLLDERGRTVAYLSELETLEKRISEDFRGNEGLPNWLMTLDFGKAFARMMRDWCDECLRKMKLNIEERKA